MKQILLLLLIVFSSIIFAENNQKNNISAGKCGTVAPGKEWENVFQKQLQKFKTNNQNARTENSIVIPVIVHVVYNLYSDLSQNIPKAQIDSQFAILNRNFSGQSSYINNVPSVFSGFVANTGITFCPAKIAPDGQVLSEPGIERINRTSIGASTPSGSGWLNTYIDELIKPRTIWDPSIYLNIWIVPRARSSNGSLLGYATFPTMTGLDGILDENEKVINTDGIVCVSYAFGKSINNDPDYNDGGTATHEIGHWLGLRHIWGDDECGDDFCNDTPTHQEENYGCPTFPKMNTCGGAPYGEMFMNYMDYVNDNCSNMFTENQKERMQTTMQNGYLRSSLLNSPVCDTILPLPLANFLDTQITQTRCASSAVFNFADKSFWSYNATSWSWTFQDGTPATSSQKDPKNITFNSPGSKNVTLTVVTPKGTSTTTRQINVVFSNIVNLPILENFEGNVFPPSGWNFFKRTTNVYHNWEIREGYSAYGIGNKSMIYNNTEFNGNKRKDDIMSPRFSTVGQTNLKINFDVAYTPFYGDAGSGTIETINDTLEVLLTDNCGSTFTSVYKKGGSDLATFLPGMGDEFYPTTNQWRKDSIIIPASFLNKAEVQVVFRNYGLWGHTIYLDNINVTGPIQNPIPNFTLSKSSICVGENVLLTNTTSGAVDSVRWKITGGTPNSSASTTTVNPSFNSAGTYNITLFIFKDTYKDSITKSITVTNKPTPTINPSSTSVCPGTSVTLTASGASTYVWNNGSTTNPLITTINNNSVFKVVGTTNGCSSDSVSITINAKTKPTVSVNSSNIQICPGESATFNASGATTYAWSNGQTGNSITVSPTNNTTYKVAGTTDGCTSDSVQVSVTIKAKPTVNVTPQNTTICAGQSATLTASGAATYGWSNGQSGTSISVSPTATTIYKVAGTASNGCKSDSVSATVTITTTNPTVTITKNPNISTICEGDSITLTASGANNYTWNTTQTTASIKVAPSTQTTYSVNGSLTGCPTLSGNANTTINVNAKPSVGTISRDASINWDTIFISPANGTNYLWFLNNAVTPIANTTVPYYSTTSSGNGNYTVQVVDANGCKSDKSASFNVVVTSIRNNAASIGLKIYPNPNYGVFTIELNAQKYSTYELSVTSVSGRNIYNETFDAYSGLNNKKIQLQNIDSGIYFLSLKNEDGISTFQLLIK